MDIQFKGTISVNNMPAHMDEKIYENFTIQCKIKNEQSEGTEYGFDDEASYQTGEENDPNEKTDGYVETSDLAGGLPPRQLPDSSSGEKKDLYVIINKEPIKLSNKNKYIFVDIFDFYAFDLRKAGGSELIITLNGEKADFTAPLQEKDTIELYWKN